MALVCQFVDTISATPIVRMDLNLQTAAVSWTTLASTDFGFPERRYAIASTLLRDGGYVAQSAEGMRTLRLRLQVKTGSADDTATQLQRLIRELDRPTNLLRTQYGSTPVFFRTYRSTPSAWSIVTTGPLAEITADVLADPYAEGLLETPVSAVTLNHDPANGTNGCFLDVTGVKGDVEAPAIIQWPSASIADDRETVFAVRRRGTPSAAPFLFQAEAMTQGTDTTTQANDANFSGAGNNYSRTTFATATMQTRLSTLDLGTASVDLRGRYRVYLRYRKNTSSDGINLRLRWGDADGWTLIDNDAYTTPTTNALTAADLGDITIPVGYDPVTDSTGAEIAVSDSFQLALRAERISGSGTIDFDFLLLIPADDALSIVHWEDDSTSPSDHWILDADGPAAYARDASNRVIGAGAPAIVGGGLPMLTPNQTNRIYMLRSTRPTDSWIMTVGSTVSVSYHPRYRMETRPVST